MKVQEFIDTLLAELPLGVDVMRLDGNAVLHMHGLRYEVRFEDRLSLSTLHIVFSVSEGNEYNAACHVIRKLTAMLRELREL